MASNVPVITMVDDDKIDAFTTMRVFRDGEITVDFNHVDDGVAFFDYLETVHARQDHDNPPPMPDIILLDINMPNMGGFEVLERLRNEPRFSPIPVVMLTTSDAAEDIETAYRCGANSYIVKPASVSEMQQFASFFKAYWFNLAKTPRAANQNWGM